MKRFSQRFRISDPVYLYDSEGDEEKEEARPVTLDDLHKVVNSALSNQEKKILKKLGQQQTSSSLDMDKLDEMVGKLLETPEPVQASEGEGGDEKEAMPHGVKAQLDKMQRELEKSRKAHEDLRRQIDDKDREVVTQRRTHALERLASEKRAINPGQVVKLLFPEIIEDDELGDAVSVRTDHGEDLVPVSDYFDTFAEENPHLFEQEKGGRSGSGAGSGSASREKPLVKAEDLRDPKDGGVSWKDYEKDPDKYREAIEKQVRGS